MHISRLFIQYEISFVIYLRHCFFFGGEISCWPLPVAWILVLTFKVRVSGLNSNICRYAKHRHARRVRVTWWIQSRNRGEVKLDVYGKRQTTKMKLLPFLFSCVCNGVRFFVFAIKSRRRYSIFVWFIYGLEEKKLKSRNNFSRHTAEEKWNYYRLPVAVNVKLNLSNISVDF